MTNTLVIQAPGTLSAPKAGTPRRLHTFPIVAPTRRWVASAVQAAVGASVGSWADLAGGPGLTQANATLQPTVELVNNVYGVKFDNVDDIAGTGTSSVSDTVFTFVAVMRTVSVVASKTMLNFNGVQVGTLSTSVLRMRGSADLPSGAPALADTGLHFVAGVANGTTGIFRLDGSTATGNIGTATPSGQIATATAPNVAIAELAYFNSALTDAQLQSIRTELKKTYSTLP